MIGSRYPRNRDDFDPAWRAFARYVAGRSCEIYLVPVTGSSLTPEELRAAAEVNSELGPGYRDAVVESFLDKVGREIDARVDARLARGQQPAPPPVPQHQHRAGDNSFRLAIVSIVLGIPITAIVTSAGEHPTGIWGLLVVWIAIAAINVAYSLHNRPRDDRRR